MIPLLATKLSASVVFPVEIDEVKWIYIASWEILYISVVKLREIIIKNYHNTSWLKIWTCNGKTSENERREQVV